MPGTHLLNSFRLDHQRSTKHFVPAGAIVFWPMSEEVVVGGIPTKPNWVITLSISVP
jgi:hypothetical protein